MAADCFYGAIGCNIAHMWLKIGVMQLWSDLDLFYIHKK